MATVRAFLEYLGYRFLTIAVPLLPRFLVVFVGRRIGGLFFWLSPRTRRLGYENLRRVFPEREKEHGHILRESCRVQAVALLDALWSVRISRKKARTVVEIDRVQLAELERQFSFGRGAVVATAHFGSWEMCNLGAGALNFPPTTFIARPINNKWIDRHLRRSREKTGNKLVYREGALFACMSALRASEIVASVIDIAIVPSEGGIFVDFLGTPACTAVALPALAVRHNSPMFFVVCRPLKRSMKYRMEIEHIPFEDVKDRKGETMRVTEKINRRLEEKIRENPEYWLWGYKRWKWRPSELGFEHFPSYSLWVHPRW